MSSLDRRTMLGAFAALGACGFTPVYGPGGAGDGLQGAVAFDEPADREAYELVKRLEQRLGRGAAATHALAYEITVTPVAAGVTAAQEISRTRLDGAVEFTLTALDSGQVAASGKVSSFTSYSNSGSTVATASVERDAYRRLMVSLADRVIDRLIATRPAWAA